MSIGQRLRPEGRASLIPLPPLLGARPALGCVGCRGLEVRGSTLQLREVDEQRRVRVVVAERLGSSGLSLEQLARLIEAIHAHSSQAENQIRRVGIREGKTLTPLELEPPIKRPL